MIFQKMGRYKSIIQSNRMCFVCGNPNNLDIHHIFNKYNKKRSEKYGLMVYPCRSCHHKVHDTDETIRRDLEKYGQKLYERHFGTREEFIREFGKSYR